MPTDRTAHRFHFKLGNKIVYTSVTGHLRRQQDLLRKSRPEWRKGHIKQVGFHTTNMEAVAWAVEQAEQGKPVPLEHLAMWRE